MATLFLLTCGGGAQLRIRNSEFGIIGAGEGETGFLNLNIHPPSP